MSSQDTQDLGPDTLAEHIPSTKQEIADIVCTTVWRNLTLDEWHKFVGTELPYEHACPNLPTHPSLFETAEKLAKEKGIEGAMALRERAVELAPNWR